MIDIRPVLTLLRVAAVAALVTWAYTNYGSAWDPGSDAVLSIGDVSSNSVPTKSALEDVLIGR